MSQLLTQTLPHLKDCQYSDRVGGRYDGSKVNHVQKLEGHGMGKKLSKSVDDKSNHRSGYERANQRESQNGAQIVKKGLFTHAIAGMKNDGGQ